MIVIDKGLVGSRVIVEYAVSASETEFVEGILFAVPDEDAALMQVERYGPLRIDPTPVRFDYVMKVEAAPLVCERCHAKYNVPRASNLCAECERRDAQQRNANHVSYCVWDDCGVAGAFRNPRDPAGRLLCPAHHVESGIPVVLNRGAGEGVTAACMAADIDDERHVWVRVRGQRYQCEGCHRPRYTRPKGVDE